MRLKREQHGRASVATDHLCFKVQGSRFKVPGSRVQVQGARFQVRPDGLALSPCVELRRVPGPLRRLKEHHMTWGSFRILVVSVVVAAHAGTAIAQPPAGRGAPPPAVRIGPSAPAPPEVTMLRPGPAELQQINDALRAFIAAD